MLTGIDAATQHATDTVASYHPIDRMPCRMLAHRSAPSTGSHACYRLAEITGAQVSWHNKQLMQCRGRTGGPLGDAHALSVYPCPTHAAVEDGTPFIISPAHHCLVKWTPGLEIAVGRSWV